MPSDGNNLSCDVALDSFSMAYSVEDSIKTKYMESEYFGIFFFMKI